MVWVETGADSSEWNFKPMQIGVTGDPGLASFLSGKEGGDLILLPVWKKQLTMGSASTLPTHNIRAGAGYLLMRMANFEYQGVLAADANVYEVTIKAPGKGRSMRTAINVVGLGLTVLAHLPTLVFAAPTVPIFDARALREECSAFAQVEMRDCLAKKVESSQEALERVGEAAASILSKWDEDGKYVNQARIKLAASNKEFVRYREAQCEFAASLSGGAVGNAHEMRRLACVAELNSRRAGQLRDVVSDIPLK
jgi:uncharacterized protein YecT (DUF1311 family)